MATTFKVWGDRLMRAWLGCLTALFSMAGLSACDAEPICDQRVVIVPESLESLKLNDTAFALAEIEPELQRLETACRGKLKVFFVINPDLPYEEQDMISDDIVAFDTVYSVTIGIATMKQNP